MILFLIGLIGMLILFLFFALGIGTATYYLAEIADEEPSKFSLWVKISHYISIGFLLGLGIFDKFPILSTGFTIISHLVTYSFLSKFPFFSFKSWNFTTSIVMVIINHIIWFFYFLNNENFFWFIFAFFTICIWIVPFLLLITLNPNEPVIPSRNQDLDLDKNESVEVSTPQLSRSEAKGLRRRFVNSPIKFDDSKSKKMQFLTIVAQSNPGNLVFLIYNLICEIREYLKKPLLPTRKVDY
ncbi:tex261 protein [Anaeramoeba ignava]|uniref:Tex261 protein n=1 Tax=Anaeramoeba ignava TaxID=1746090 RepID=A0A9Q0LSW4_ANAIG|nr:tex261 protein [Anaeramoeba ignava]